MRPISAVAAAQEIAAIRVNEICNLLFSLRYLHSRSREEEVFCLLDEREEDFHALQLDFDSFRTGARWAVVRQGTCRPDGHPRAPGGGRKPEAEK